MKRVSKSIIMSFTMSRTYRPTLLRRRTVFLLSFSTVCLALVSSRSLTPPSTVRFKNLQVTRPFSRFFLFSRTVHDYYPSTNERGRGTKEKGERKRHAGEQKDRRAVDEEKIKDATRTDHPSPLGVELTQHYVLLTAPRT